MAKRGRKPKNVVKPAIDTAKLKDVVKVIETAKPKDAAKAKAKVIANTGLAVTSTPPMILRG